MIVGQRVKWRHLNAETKQPVLDVTGVVVAIALTANREWRVVIQRDDGTHCSHSVEDLVALGSNSEALEAGREAMHAIEYLERYLEEQFPDTDAGGGPVEWASSLLGQLKAELLEVGAQRDKVVTEIIEVRDERDKLAKKLAAAEKKLKAKGDKSEEPKPEGS